MVSKRFPSSAMRNMVERMCLSQCHGGPDDQGIFVSEDGFSVFGHRRLALFDLTPAGHQPMEFGGRYTITYNGELYNYPELKSELTSLGYSFKSQSDTEVILASFSEWNTQSFGKFSGMFAFALHDRIDNVIYLVRDPAGIKPLYFSEQDDSLVFASEVRAFSHSMISLTEHSGWPVYLMAYGHIPEPLTTYREVTSLCKGCYLKYDISAMASSVSSFSFYSFNSYPVSFPYVSEIRSVMHSAVRRHLLADAPVGVFLSGGLDSGIIATLASEISKKEINTLSVFFEDKEFSEKPYQDMILEHLRSIPEQHLITRLEFEGSFDDIISSMDLPSCDGINTWFISRMASRKGLKAVLSGIGADELFGGYPSFRRMLLSQILQTTPDPFLKIFKRSRYKRLDRLSYLSIDGIKGIYLFLRGNFNPYEIADYLDADEQEIWNILNEQPLTGGLNGLHSKDQASWMEFHLYLQNQLLRDADVMGMCHGVEIRVPFLDDELIRLAMSIPPKVKYAGAGPKRLLIDAFSSRLPEVIWNRPKMGFSFPLQQWLSESQYVLDLVNQGHNGLKSQYARFEKGNMHWAQLMSLILLNRRGYA